MRVELADLYGGEDEGSSLVDDAREVLLRSPEDALANLTVARALERTNHVRQARRHVDAALAREPRRTDACILRIRLERRLGNAEQARRLGEALLREHPVADDARSLHFELGKACEALADYDAAFRHFAESNRLHTAVYGPLEPSRSGIVRYIDGWQRRLSRRWIDAWSTIEAQPTSPDPVFLLGFPRSGTTLLHQMLACHPDVQIMEERPCMRIVEQRIVAEGGTFPDDLAALDSERATALRDEYARQVASFVDLRRDALFIDKLPMHLVRAGTIHRLFPAARMIFVARHPADVCLSAWSQIFSDGDLIRHFTGLDTTVDLYDRSMRLWSDLRRLLPLTVHVVRYEELVSDPEGRLRDLLRFLRLRWNPESVQFAAHPMRHRYIRTPSYAQASQPLYRSSVQRWRRYEEHLRPFLAKLEPHMQTLGYDDDAFPGEGRR